MTGGGGSSKSTCTLAKGQLARSDSREERGAISARYARKLARGGCKRRSE